MVYVVTHIAVFLMSDPAFILFALFLLLAGLVRLLILLLTALTVRLFRRLGGMHGQQK
ncbi:hypothetical protein [Arthrobacter sp. ISL-65]|uniref:hypothetical protein n=1 Tax=Arthrobacter sp. ISL-65 TaxID=2819112 RepID=UPI001BE64052|nr:hypothetical protein [Arthrobacter sp. ISL-65]MBT2548047.1 hypothetical protein [Arthrobacter sp. ISL-65]